MPIITSDDRPTSVTNPSLDPMIATYGDTIGARATDRLDGVMREFGANAISSRNLTDRTFNFTEGTALGVRLEEKVYDASEPYVLSSPVRNAVAENLRAIGGGRKVAFVESCGLVELGGGFMGTLPLALFTYGGVGIAYGFTASALLRYRTSTPKLLGFGDRGENNFINRKVAFPINAQAASMMPPGSEVELTGQGKVNVDGAVGASVGPSVAGVATAGIGAVIAGAISIADELSLNVMALDKPGLVRVTIRNLDEETAAFMARIRAGLIFKMPGFVPHAAGGMLRYYTQKLGAPNFQELINLYTTLSAGLMLRTAHRGVTIGSWDLDLSQPEARDAYEHLLRLNIVPAEELAQSGSRAVTVMRVSESEFEFKFGADVMMLGQKLFIYEALSAEREGRLERSYGKDFMYRDSFYRCSVKNILTGSKEIEWQAVSLKKEDGESEPYLRVHFEQNDYDFGTNDVSRMLRFADAMKIPNEEVAGTDLKRLEQAGKRLAKMAEVKISTDVYFTKAGIENIDRANAADAKYAYLSLSSTIHKKYQGIDLTATDEKGQAARSLIEEYRSLTGIENVKKAATRLKVLPQLRKEYFELTGRKLAGDAKLMRQADEFGSAVEQLKDTRSAEQVSSFFLTLGRRKGFDYMHTVAALSALAGEEETLINNLSIQGGPITIKNNSEGKIASPRDIIANELHRVPTT